MTLYNLTISKTPSVGHINCWSPIIKKKEMNKPNVFECIVLNSNPIVLGDEIKFYDLNNVYSFGGKVQKVINQTGALFIEVSDYSIQLFQDRVSEVFRDSSPESIIQYIIETYTNFTFSSSIVTGLSISKIVFKDEYLADIITKCLDLFNGGYEVDRQEVFSLFVMSDSASPKNITNLNSNIKKKWETDNLPRGEKVVVIGSLIDQRITETLVGTGTEFFTSYIPNDIEITGLQQTTSNIIGDYRVDKENKKIIFDTSKTDPVINYTYQSRVRVEIGTGKTIILEKPYIETEDEAIELASNYFERFKDGSQSSTWIKADDNIDNYKVGNKIFVNDLVYGYTDFFVIKSVKLTYPSQMEIEIGETINDLFDWQKESMERIKELEKKDQNEDFITNFELIDNNVEIQVSTEVELQLYRDLPDDYMYLGDSNDTPVYANIGAGIERPLAEYIEDIEGWYPLSEEDTTNDISGNGNDGTLVGWSPETLWQELDRENVDFVANTTTDSSVSGLDGTMVGFDRNDGTVSGGVTIEDGAMVFDGVNGYINSNQGTSNLGVVAGWLHVDDLNTRYNYWGSANARQTLQFREDQGKVFFAQGTNQANDATKRIISSPITTTGLYFVVVDYYGNKIYVNGVDTTAQNPTIGFAGHATNWYIGRFLSSYLNGKIESVFIYSAITQSQVTEIYNAGKDAYTPISDGLVAQYSGKDFTGTELLPTTIYDTNMIVSDGSGGTALKFDGVDDYVNLGNPTELNFGATESFSISLVLDSNLGLPFSKMAGGGATNVFWAFERSTLTNHAFIVNDGTGRVTSIFPNTFVNGEPNHIVAVVNREDNTITIYNNGVAGTPVSIAGKGSFNNVGENIILGNRNPSFNSWYPGTIKNTRIFPRVLSVEEIGQITTNPTVALPLYRSGKQFDKALYFNGIDRYVSLPDTILNDNGNFAITLWVKEQNTSTRHHFIRKGGQNFFIQAISNYYEFALYDNATSSYNNLRIFERTSTDWSFLYVEYKNNGDGTFTTYIQLNNGVSATRTETGIRKANNDSINIGNSSGSGLFFPMNGLIQDVRIYDQTLTEEERDPIYNDGLGSIYNLTPKDRFFITDKSLWNDPDAEIAEHGNYVSWNNIE